jgi:uncharacterized protein
MVTVRKFMHRCVGEVLSVSSFFDDSVSSSEKKTGFLALHGAGNSDRSRCVAVCNAAAKLGLKTFSFDFSGAGRSSKNGLPSVQKRTEEAQAVLEALLSDCSSVIVLAFSMSGHVAISLTKFNPKISGLILCSPALYSQSAVTIPFGPSFSENIRRPNSWKESCHESTLADFEGKTVLLRPKRDDVIPEGVFEIIERSSQRDRFKKVIFDDAPHTMGSWFNENTAIAEEAIAASIAFIQSSYG